MSKLGRRLDSGLSMGDGPSRRGVSKERRASEAVSACRRPLSSCALSRSLRCEWRLDLPGEASSDSDRLIWCRRVGDVAFGELVTLRFDMSPARAWPLRPLLLVPAAAKNEADLLRRSVVETGRVMTKEACSWSVEREACGSWRAWSWWTPPPPPSAYTPLAATHIIHMPNWLTVSLQHHMRNTVYVLSEISTLNDLFQKTAIFEFLHFRKRLVIIVSHTAIIVGDPKRVTPMPCIASCLKASLPFTFSFFFALDKGDPKESRTMYMNK